MVSEVNAWVQSNRRAAPAKASPVAAASAANGPPPVAIDAAVQADNGDVVTVAASNAVGVPAAADTPTVPQDPDAVS